MATFFLAQLSLAILGCGAAFHPSLRSLGLFGRIAAAFGAGAVALTLEATAFSIVNLPWTIPRLGIPLLVASVVSGLCWRKRSAAARAAVRISRGIAICYGAICAASLIYLALSLTSSSATSMDFLFFWGVKAVRFAHARGLDAAFLSNAFTIHAVPDYPPLVPVTQAWGCLAAGYMPWRAAPVTSAWWLVAAIPLLFERLRQRFGDGRAAAVLALWVPSLCISLVFSYSGGNAEAPLLFFESIAVAWLLTEGGPGESRLVPIVALCGAALTKVEGSLAVLLVALGCIFKDRGIVVSERLRKTISMVCWPALTLSIWFLFQASRSLRVGYRTHGDLLRLYPEHLGVVLDKMLTNLEGGSLWLPWILAILFISTGLRVWRSAAPALVLASGLLAFLVFDYLHDGQDPTERIAWTAPRVSQPALSAALLGAGVMSIGRMKLSGQRGAISMDNDREDPRESPA